jgi:Tol biopolymer transport system component
MAKRFVRRRWLGAVLYGALLAAADAGIVHDPALHWRTLHTPHFAVHYHDGGEETARRAAAIAERMHERLTAAFDWTPADRTDLVISDETDLTNGNATPLPANRSNLLTAPPDVISGLEEDDGWLEELIVHEYTHIVHLDKASGYPRALRYAFGRLINVIPFLNTFPNVMQPTWGIEGLAVYNETDRERGAGRGQSSYFDMLMRMEIDGGFKPVRQVNWRIDTWPAGATPYLYGVEYYNFIAATRSRDKIYELVDRYSNDFVPYMVNTASKGAFDKNLSRMWEEFEAYERSKHEPTLRAIRDAGVRAGERLSDDGFAAGSLKALPDGRAFYVAFDGRNDPALMVYRPGAPGPEKLAEVQGGARIDVHATAGVLAAQLERCRNARYYYDLYRYDATSGRRERLTRCARYRQAAWSPTADRIAAVHHEMSKSRLDVLDARGRVQDTWWSGASDEVIGQLDWSPDGASLVAAVWRRESGWNIEQFAIAERRWRTLTNDTAVDGQPRFTSDGKAVLFTSDHGGVYNLRRIDLATGRIDTLSNVVGGAFYPSEGGAALYYIGYGPQGFDLHRMTQVSAGATPTAPPGPSVIVEPDPPAIANARITDYNPIVGMRPHSWWPWLEVNEDQFEVGASTSGSDPLYRHNYSIAAAYDFENHTPVGRIDYIYDRWYPTVKLRASRNNDFDRGADNEVLRMRREDELGAELIFPLLKYHRTLSLRIGALGEKDSDERLAAGQTPFGTFRDRLLGVALTYDSTVEYPLSVSRSHGREIRLIAESSDVFDSDYTGKRYTLDWRELIALGREHVLSLRWVEGYGTDDPRPFELGGMDPAPELPGLLGGSAAAIFNQREYALRGYPDGRADLTDRRMRLASVEYRFPLWRVERGSMVPVPIALHQLYGTVFVDSGTTWHDSVDSDDYRTGAGFEIGADVGFLYSGRFKIRLGYAHGFDLGGEDQVYLRAGASF